MERRDFLKAGLAAAVGQHASGVQPPLITVPRGVRQLFLDDYTIAEVAHLTRTLQPVRKHPANPLLQADRPWEGGLIILDNAVAYDPGENLYKMWYFVPGFVLGGRRRTCYATSRDGITWERPNLRLAEIGGSLENNVLPDHVSHVLYCPELRGEPARLVYKGVGYESSGQYVSFSRDGFVWTGKKFLKLPHTDVFIPCKSTAIQRDPTRGGGAKPGSDPTAPDQSPRYLGFARLMAQVGKFNRRVIFATASENFIDWTEPAMILKPDERDDEMAVERVAALRGVVPGRPEDYHCEFYHMVGFLYEGIYLGFLYVYDVNTTPFNREEPVAVPTTHGDGPRQVQLVASRDLRNWERVGARESLIPLGPPDAWDRAMIGYNAVPILARNEIRIYYSGQSLTHGSPHWMTRVAQVQAGQRKPDLSSIGLGTLRRDGFVSLDAGEQEGYLLTKPFSLSGGQLHLNADAKGGMVRVAICDETGKTLTGFSSSLPATDDALDAVITWKGRDPRSLVGQKVRLRLRARRAKIYAFWFE
jgi:hypothetical protein